MRQNPLTSFCIVFSSRIASYLKVYVVLPIWWDGASFMLYNPTYMLLRKHKAEFANVHMPSLLLSNDYIAGEKRARLSSYLVYCLSRLVAAREHRYRTRRCQPSRREGMQRRRSLE